MESPNLKLDITPVHADYAAFYNRYIDSLPTPHELLAVMDLIRARYADTEVQIRIVGRRATGFCVGVWGNKVYLVGMVAQSFGPQALSDALERVREDLIAVFGDGSCQFRVVIEPHSEPNSSGYILVTRAS